MQTDTNTDGGPNDAGADSNAAAMAQDIPGAPLCDGLGNYAPAGEVFTNWFNDKVRRLVNPTIQLGTKTASVVQLLPDGRLECSLHGATGEEQQTFVAFEAQYLDQLVRRIGAIGL